MPLSAFVGGAVCSPPGGAATKHPRLGMEAAGACSLPALGPGVPDQGSRAGLPQASRLASGSLLAILGIPGLGDASPHLCLCLHVASSPRTISFLRKDTCHRILATPGQTHLEIF